MLSVSAVHDIDELLVIEGLPPQARTVLLRWRNRLVASLAEDVDLPSVDVSPFPPQGG